MKKALLSFCLLLVMGTVIAQPKKSVVRLIRSDRSEGIKRNGRDVLKVYNGTFQQDYSTLRSDSAYFYPQDNAFDAFGNVNITQGDTLNIFSDKLNYNGNTKTAILTDNVKMVDRDATLTTNYLTYNTATRIGTYTGGGKLVNKDNTLTSRNGYYFAYSRDAYFRYDVVLNTVDALIKTDTMRYNTGTRISYFYGPTNIYGKAKDPDTLYTEYGQYHTITGQAYFSKKNLYKQGTKSLKGDSLFYDRFKGFGRAVKNITFNDREQKVTLKGDLGTYYKKEERALVTQNAYVVIVTEEKDTTATDSVLKQITAVKKDSLARDTLKKPVKLPTSVKLPIQTTLKKPAPAKVPVATKPPAKGKPQTKSNIIINDKGQRVRVDSVFMSADTLETIIFTHKKLTELQERRRLANVRDTSVKSKPPSIVYKTPLKYITLDPPRFRRDSARFWPEYFGKPKPPVVDSAAIKKAAQLAAEKKAKADSLAKLPPVPGKVDSVYLTTKVKLSDTSRVRVIFAYHDAKIFKSDLQAKADSMFYSYSDSTIRCFIKPMVWTQGSQMSGDTINLQLKNRKLDNMEIYLNSFIVNIEKNDSTTFNQVGGKKMRGFFKDSKLDVMYVDGNAESIYFARDSATNRVTGMERSLSSRMRIRFKNSKATNLVFLSKPDIKYGPLSKFTEDDRVLKGFIWKPKERPVSKEVIINSARRKAANRAAAKAEAAANAAKLAKQKAKQDTSASSNTTAGKPPATPAKPAAIQKVTTGAAAVDSATNAAPRLREENRNRVSDGTLNTAPVIMPAVPPKQDTAIVRPPQPAIRRDSTQQ